MNRPPHRQEEDVSLMPLPVQRRNGTMRHRRGSVPGKRRRIVTIGAAIIAVAAIALGITLYQQILGAYRPAAGPPAASIRFLPGRVYQGSPRLV